ncbi:DNA-(apurinic or apyrimidinic site) lyase /endonuclease III [Paenibacillus sp. RU4T]|nr:DNA-(apurinic or apyrimidinic site) lyase /endonuclease III [Paenibacillus sp. RU4X]SIQ66756.1 DNA-(apurinic or apyrimidinic site) lyase /endonuclease III [Paenibacillus sp. RU4T]
MTMKASDKMRRILDTMAEMFPDAHCELNHANPFELTIAVLLSAQCTDETVNRVTADLFQKYRVPEDYLAVDLEELQQDIRRIGLFRNKAANIQKLCRILLDRYGGEIPERHDQLTELPGVGRKTANVVVSNAFGVPAIAVDTHVERVSKRLGLAKQEDSVLEVEKKLMRKVPREEWTLTHHRFIFFGRYHCKAQQPKCDICPLLDMCKEGQRRMKAACTTTKSAAASNKRAAASNPLSKG